MMQTSSNTLKNQPSAKILLANGIFLMLIGLIAMLVDLAGALASVGPFAHVLQQYPPVAAPAVEAHGLAAIIGFLLFMARQTPRPRWHLTALLVHLLLASANLLFWQSTFEMSGLILLGIVTTAFHIVFIILQTYGFFITRQLLQETQ